MIFSKQKQQNNKWKYRLIIIRLYDIIRTNKILKCHLKKLINNERDRINSFETIF